MENPHLLPNRHRKKHRFRTARNLCFDPFEKSFKPVIFRRIVGEEQHVHAALCCHRDEMMLGIGRDEGIRPRLQGERNALLVHARAAETCDPLNGPIAVDDEPFGAKGLFDARRICRKRRFFHFEDAPVRAAADYTDWELRFGRDNLRSPSPAFLKWIRGEREKLRERLSSPAMSHESREELRKRQYELEVILDAIEGDV